MSIHYRIEQVVDEDEQLLWEIGLYKDGRFVGGCAYPTFPQAVDAFAHEDWSGYEPCKEGE